MTTIEIEGFKMQYEAIKDKVDEVAKAKQKVKTLTMWDRNDSHKNAIVKAIENFERLVAELETMLRGKTYEQWKATRNRLAQLNIRLQKSIKQKEKIENEILQVIFL